MWHWLHPAEVENPLLSAWPMPRSAHWAERVNQPLTEAELHAVRRSTQRGSPFGESAWTEPLAQRLGLASTLRPRGRPQVRLLREEGDNES